jgi:hypothetical protein
MSAQSQRRRVPGNVVGRSRPGGACPSQADGDCLDGLGRSSRVQLSNAKILPPAAKESPPPTALELLAIKAVIAQVLGRIHRLDPILAEAIECGFEDAISEVRALGTEARKGTGTNKVLKAIATIESLQEAALNRRVRPGLPAYEKAPPKRGNSSS